MRGKCFPLKSCVASCCYTCCRRSHKKVLKTDFIPLHATTGMNCIWQCNPTHAYVEVSPILFNGTCSPVSINRIAASVSKLSSGNMCKVGINKAVVRSKCVDSGSLLFTFGAKRCCFFLMISLSALGIVCFAE